jgi:CheY-like chemotaxis protein
VKELRSSYRETMKEQRHLMFADDDADDLYLFREAVNEVDPQKIISLVDSGQRLLDKLQVVLPDILFLDINMPGINGLQCLEMIRSHAHLDVVPIVIYSTTAEAGHVEKAYQSGANLFIRKPNTFEKMKAQIARILSLNINDFFPQPQKEKFLMEPEW